MSTVDVSAGHWLVGQEPVRSLVGAQQGFDPLAQGQVVSASPARYAGRSAALKRQGGGENGFRLADVRVLRIRLS